MDLNNQIPDNYKIGNPVSQEDGSDVYELIDKDATPDPLPPSEEKVIFEENLAEKLSDDVLSRIASSLFDQVQEDITSRESWLDSVNRVKDYLGFSIEDTKNIPFPNATRTFDTTLSTSLVRFYATMRSEFFPDQGPAHVKLSENSEPDSPQDPMTADQIEMTSEKVKTFLNNYLTINNYFKASSKLQKFSTKFLKTS